MVKVLLQSIPAYAMSCFKFQNGSIKRLRLFYPYFGGAIIMRKELYVLRSGML